MAASGTLSKSGQDDTTEYKTTTVEFPEGCHNMTLQADKKIPVGLAALKQYPIEELYRLIVDGRLHKKEMGWIGYENREPGCLKAAFNGLALAITNINDTVLTLSFIKQLHLTCTENVQNIECGNTPGRLRSEPMKDMAGFTITPEGIVELLDMIEHQKDFPKYHSAWIGSFDAPQKMNFDTAIYYHSIRKMRDYYKVEDNKQLAEHLFQIIKQKKCGYIAPRAGKIFDSELTSIIETYNLTIVDAKDDASKLKIIVSTIYELEHIHPFMDANIRTFAILLLDRLLIQNGFVPATFYNPNFFDAHSKKELIEVLKQSMQNTKDILKGKKDMFEFDSSDIPQTFQSEYFDIIFDFISTIEEVSTQTQTIKQELLSSTSQIALAMPMDTKTESTARKTSEQTPDTTHTLLQAVVYAEYDEVKKILDEASLSSLEKLLTTPMEVVDYSGRHVYGTALQLALGAGDVSRPQYPDEGIAELIMSYYKKLPDGESLKQAHIDEFAKHAEISCKKNEKDLEAVETVFKSILDAKPDDECEEALQTFRKYLEPDPNEFIRGKHFNHHMLMKAYELYATHYKNFDESWVKDFSGFPINKKILVWTKVIGYLQRFLPACDAQVMAQGLSNLMTNDERLRRSLELLEDQGVFIFPLFSETKWGYDCACAQYPFLDTNISMRGSKQVHKFFMSFISIKNERCAAYIAPQPSTSSVPALDDKTEVTNLRRL